MPKSTKPTTDDKLDIIIGYLHKMNRRDRIRMIGGLIRGIISLIPILILLASIWYVYLYGDQILEKVAATAARQAANVTTINTEKLMRSLDIRTIFEGILPQ